MKNLGFLFLSFVAVAAFADEAPPPQVVVTPHSEIPEHQMLGNTISGLATPSKGAKQFEVWRSSLPPGSRTPPHHVHDTEEVFIFLKGKGKAVVNGKETEFVAPCTVVLPAHVPHYYMNTGTEPTDAIVVIGIGSQIRDKDMKLMDLPWRK
jgi:mannose-6-phosphate isomerase-like protein (cupin superfamily)